MKHLFCETSTFTTSCQNVFLYWIFWYSRQPDNLTHAQTNNKHTASFFLQCFKLESPYLSSTCCTSSFLFIILCAVDFIADSKQTLALWLSRSVSVTDWLSLRLYHTHGLDMHFLLWFWRPDCVLDRSLMSDALTAHLRGGAKWVGKQIKSELTGSSVGLKSHWGKCHFLST